MVIGICAILIVSFAAYSAIASSNNQECRANATLRLTLVEIPGTKWTVDGREYLIRWKNVDSKADWTPQFIVDALVNAERNATNSNTN